MPPRPRVFVPQYDPDKNLLPAEQWGELVYMLQPSDTGAGISHGLQKLKDHLKDIGPQDFVLLVGDPIAIGVTCALAADYGYGKLNMLKWDRQERKYFKVSLKLFLADEPSFRQPA